MKFINNIFFAIFLFLFLSTHYESIAQISGGNKEQINKTNYFRHFTHFNINKISTYIYNDGVSDVNNRGIAGLVYPKGSARTGIYESSLVWGGIIDGKLRVGGANFISGLQPGKIISRGVSESAEDTSLRVYRVRPDYKASDLISEINDGEGTKANIRAQYKNDWNEWPASKGAPFQDADDNGKYDPLIDIPGMPGAHQTLWFVCNDLDSILTKNLFGSLPLGIEMQVTVWGYNLPYLNHIIFKKYKLINKSEKNISDMYIAMGIDPDLGDQTDDLVGCDTLLNLGYVYNANVIDNVYRPLPPPAGGFVCLQGPVVEGEPGDSAHFDGRILLGKKNLEMTGFYYTISGNVNFHYPVDAVEMYNLLQSKIENTGEHFSYPEQFGGGLTNYLVPGDPVTKTGWIDGVTFLPGNRTMGMSSGPFNFAPSDTQEVIYAEIFAGADSSDTNLSAITLLKQYAKEVQSSYFSIDYSKTYLPEDFMLSQNYPNPFNPSTTILYNIPKSEFITLKIYDILGREVKTLINGTVNAGYHKFIFNGSSLASGIYFYRITAGDFSSVKKMVLLK